MFISPYPYFRPYNWIRQQNQFDFQQKNGYFFSAGNILPSRFIFLQGDGKVRQSVYSEYSIGISPEGTNNPLGQYCAERGTNMPYYGEAQECWIMAGGYFPAGARLRPDAEGKAITAPARINGSALALEAGQPGQLVRVRVKRVIPLGGCWSEFDYEYNYSFGCGNE